MRVFQLPTVPVVVVLGKGVAGVTSSNALSATAFQLDMVVFMKAMLSSAVIGFVAN